jgi:hypothetical protein
LAIEVPPDVMRYAGEVAGVFQRTFGDQAVAAYLHGSTVLGGFYPSRSDVDILAVVAAPAPRAQLAGFAATVGHDRLPCPAVGLELDLLTLDAVRRPARPCPFQLNFTSGADGDRVMFGEDHGPYGDGLMHIAVTRVAGLALAGAPPELVLGEIPRAWVLAECTAELEWASTHASTAYQALNAARAWLFAEKDVQASKIDAARWALGRGHDQVLLDAIAFQQAASELLPDAGATSRLTLDASRALTRAPAQLD